MSGDSTLDKGHGFTLIELILMAVITVVVGSLAFSYAFPERTPGGKFKAACIAAGGVPIMKRDWMCYEKGVVIPIEQ